ncbi:hypothetical protein BK120_30800 [Paenibacillus sp. FSL A5-0031]|nr:hypothetical protein BK120_30800 [Paenibacillus sp. FSL A5-0031]
MRNKIKFVFVIRRKYAEYSDSYDSIQEEFLIFQKIRNLFKTRRLKHQLKLLKPIHVILHENKEVFEDHWQARTEAYESLPEEDIQSILVYTQKKLNEISNYLNTIKFNKQSKDVLFFFTDYVDHLLKYHKNKFDMRYHLQYMYLYSELLLGSQRYIAIKNNLREIEGGSRKTIH